MLTFEVFANGRLLHTVNAQNADEALVLACEEHPLVSGLYVVLAW